MKKVRYATGALGALGVMPALGLVIPAATAAAPQALARAGKTVSLAPAVTAPCNARYAQASVSSLTFNRVFTADIEYSRNIGCIGMVSGNIQNSSNTGWWMRVRSYANGKMLYSRFNKNGHINTGPPRPSINWHSSPRHTGIQQVCEALVRSTAPTTVRWGPVCEQTGYTG